MLADVRERGAERSMHGIGSALLGDIGSYLEAAVDWVVAMVRDWGYGGIVVMMTVESSIFPFPSEVAMIPAGMLAARGEMSAVAAVVCGVFGSLLGASLNYALAIWLGRPILERIGRYFFLKQAQFDAAERYFSSHGEVTTLVGRLIPGIRQLISVPAGIARMPVARFGIYTALGSGLWSSVLVWVGYVAGNNEAIWRGLLREATLYVLGGACLLIALYIYLHRRKRALSNA